MPRVTLEDKCHRMLQFLLALRVDAIAHALRSHGFKQETLERGWALLRAAAGDRLSEVVPAEEEPHDLALLDRWENHWYPIASATLQANYPETHSRVFHKLSQTTGRSLVPNMLMLLDRLDSLTADGASERERGARGLLAERGLTDARVAEARSILARLQTIQPADDEPLERARVERKAHEAAMWSFYREWTTIARAAVQSRGHLKRMGFARTAGATDKAPAAGDDALEDAGRGPGD